MSDLPRVVPTLRLLLWLLRTTEMRMEEEEASWSVNPLALTVPSAEAHQLPMIV